MICGAMPSGVRQGGAAVQSISSGAALLKRKATEDTVGAAIEPPGRRNASRAVRLTEGRIRLRVSRDLFGDPPGRNLACRTFIIIF
jgi:hypothetical protein